MQSSCHLDSFDYVKPICFGKPFSSKKINMAGFLSLICANGMRVPSKRTALSYSNSKIPFQLDEMLRNSGLHAFL